VFEGAPPANVNQLMALPTLQSRLNEYPSPIRIHYNVANPIIQDINVRRAIAMCIPRDEISTKVFQGINPPEYNMYPSYYPWASNSVDKAPPYDPAGAARLLEQAGYRRNSNGFYITGISLTLFPGDTSDVAMLIQAACTEAGIDLALEVLEYNSWAQKVATDRDFVIEMQGGFMGPDPAAMIPIFGTDGARNYGNYSNPRVDELLRRGGEVYDQGARGAFYHEAQKILAEELPYVPIVVYASYEFFNADLINLPIDGAGKWGWAEYTFTDFK